MSIWHGCSKFNIPCWWVSSGRKEQQEMGNEEDLEGAGWWRSYTFKSLDFQIDKEKEVRQSSRVDSLSSIMTLDCLRLSWVGQCCDTREFAWLWWGWSFFRLFMMPETMDFGASGPCSNKLKVISNFNEPLHASAGEEVWVPKQKGRLSRRRGWCEKQQRREERRKRMTRGKTHEAESMVPHQGLGL